MPETTIGGALASHSTSKAADHEPTLNWCPDCGRALRDMSLSNGTTTFNAKMCPVCHFSTNRTIKDNSELEQK